MIVQLKKIPQPQSTIKSMVKIEINPILLVCIKKEQSQVPILQYSSKPFLECIQLFQSLKDLIIIGPFLCDYIPAFYLFTLTMT